MLDVTEKEDLMITCVSGITIRMAVNKISEQSRATQGVKLIKVDEGDEIAAITQLDEKEEELEEVIISHEAEALQADAAIVEDLQKDTAMEDFTKDESDDEEEKKDNAEEI